MLAAGTLLGFSACTSVPNDRAMRPRAMRPLGRSPITPQTPSAPETPSRVRFLLMNPHDTSGWVAFDDGATAETEIYRVVVVRESTGELLYDGRAPLSVNLRESGFEMDEGDPRFQEIIQSADRHLVTPLLEIPDAPRETAPAVTQPRPQPPLQTPQATAQVATAEAEPPQSSNHISILEITDDVVLLDLGNEDNVSPGQRMFMRTPPEILVNPVTGEETILSRGRVSALLEIISVDTHQAQPRLLDGDVPEKGYFELID